MITKQNIIRTIESLPETFSIDEVIEKLLLLKKIQIGLEQSESGEVYSEADAKRKLKQWFK